MASLRARLAYAHNVLGVSLELICTSAGMSGRALRRYKRPSWNPSCSTMVALDESLAKHLDTWVAAHLERLASQEGSVTI